MQRWAHGVMLLTDERPRSRIGGTSRSVGVCSFRLWSRHSARLGVSVEEAFALLRRCARTHDDHLTEVSRRLMAQPEARPEILKAMSQVGASPS
jgi:hypothetical protein